MLRSARSLLLLCIALSAASCGDDQQESERIEVVATTTQLADMARNVAGRRAAVRGLLGPNADPHDYEVRPSDIDALSEATVVLQSGGDVDEWLGEAVRGAGGSPTVVKLADAIRAAKDSDDPHWWQDPRNAMTAVTTIRDVLARADPQGAPTYRANAAAYLDVLSGLDASVAKCVQEVPPDARKLVTTHDALGFYARRYGFEVIGTVIPSRSTRAQPSAGETAELVETIRREGVRAVFAESSVDPSVEEAVARDAGASIGEPLYADTLGPRGSDGDTYVKSIQANTRALVAGLSGGAASCAMPAAAAQS